MVIKYLVYITDKLEIEFPDTESNSFYFTESEVTIQVNIEEDQIPKWSQLLKGIVRGSKVWLPHQDLEKDSGKETSKVLNVGIPNPPPLPVTKKKRISIHRPFLKKKDEGPSRSHPNLPTLRSVSSVDSTSEHKDAASLPTVRSVSAVINTEQEDQTNIDNSKKSKSNDELNYAAGQSGSDTSPSSVPMIQPPSFPSIMSPRDPFSPPPLASPKKLSKKARSGDYNKIIESERPTSPQKLASSGEYTLSEHLSDERPSHPLSIAQIGKNQRTSSSSSCLISENEKLHFQANAIGGPKRKRSRRRTNTQTEVKDSKLAEHPIQLVNKPNETHSLVENEKTAPNPLLQTQPITNKSPRIESSTNTQPSASSTNTSPTTPSNVPPPLPDIDCHKKELLLEIKNFKIDNNRTLRAEYNRMRLEQLKELSDKSGHQVILTATFAGGEPFERKDGLPSPIPSPTGKPLESPSKKQNIYEDSSLDDSGVEHRPTSSILPPPSVPTKNRKRKTEGDKPRHTKRTTEKKSDPNQKSEDLPKPKSESKRKSDKRKRSSCEKKQGESEAGEKEKEKTPTPAPIPPPPQEPAPPPPPPPVPVAEFQEMKKYATEPVIEDNKEKHKDNNVKGDPLHPEVFNSQQLKHMFLHSNSSPLDKYVKSAPDGPYVPQSMDQRKTKLGTESKDEQVTVKSKPNAQTSKFGKFTNAIGNVKKSNSATSNAGISKLVSKFQVLEQNQPDQVKGKGKTGKSGSALASSSGFYQNNKKHQFHRTSSNSTPISADNEVVGASTNAVSDMIKKFSAAPQSPGRKRRTTAGSESRSRLPLKNHTVPSSLESFDLSINNPRQQATVKTMVKKFSNDPSDV